MIPFEIGDSACPIGTDWQQQTTFLPEKAIVLNGCHDCPFVKTRKDYCTVGRDDNHGLAVNHYFINKIFHPECPLLTHSIKIFKS